MAAPSTPRPVTPVSILADRLAWIREHLGAVDPRLVAEVGRAAELAAGLDAYTARLTTPESEPLRALAERTAREDWGHHTGGLEQEMLSGHLEGQLLAFLVHATGAWQVLEIGMFTGYSALAMAEALESRGGEGRVVACEIDADVARFAQECFAASPAGSRIDVRVGPALDTLASLAEAGAAYDLVFIDADKAGYVSYLTRLLDADLLTPGALVCVDNTLMQGEPWLAEKLGGRWGAQSTANGAAIADFNEAVAADPRVEQVVLPVRDGITLIRRVDR